MSRLSAGVARRVLPLAGACALLIAALLIMMVFIGEQERAGADLLRAIDADNASADLLSAVQDAETGQRGFLLTGDETYLAPYNTAKGRIDDHFRWLETAYANRPEAAAALAELKRVVADKLAELAQTIALQRADKTDDAMDIVDTDRGLQLMDNVRAIIARLQTANYSRILDIRRHASAVGLRVEAALVTTIVTAMGIALLVLLAAHRRETRLAATVAELGNANAELSLAADRRERLEAQLRQSQKMEAVGQLTGGLAHDFNNMLAVVIGSLNMIKRKLGRGETDVGKYADYANDGAERAVILTQRLLAFSRRQALSPETLDLNRIVPGLSELLRRTLGETVRLETIQAGSLWYTEADANQLESALVNLAVNARDAMPGGGTLTVETANAWLDEAYARENDVEVGQYVMVAVSDSGSGMTPDVAAKAFDPFFTTKQVGHGTGLGLSQVYGFVKQSGGHIKIYSEPGKGTTVKLYLPRTFTKPAPAGKPAREAAENAVPTGHPGEIILVVEDEERVRRLTVESLRDLKYTVIHAGGGADALQLLDAHPDISLLFTDVVMPGLTGKELADAARLKRPDLKVLFTTGYTRNAIVHQGVLEPDIELISKPFGLSQLARKVREVIEA